MISFEELRKDDVDKKILELFPELIIRKGAEFVSESGMHCRIMAVGKEQKSVGLYDLNAKLAFCLEYGALRKMLADPKVRIL